MTKQQIFAIVATFWLLMGCTNRSDKLTQCFQQIQSQLGKPYLQKLIAIPPDSLCYEAPAFISKSFRTTFKGPCATCFMGIKQQYMATEVAQFGDEVFLRLFLMYLKQQTIDSARARKEVFVSMGNREKIWRQMDSIAFKDLENFIKLNNDNCHVGDTINIRLEIKGDPKYYIVVLSRYFPSTIKLSDDTVKISGIVRAKYHDKSITVKESWKEVELINLFFKIEITKISLPTVHIFDSPPLKVGDYYYLPLEFYPRKILKPNYK